MSKQTIKTNIGEVTIVDFPKPRVGQYVVYSHPTAFCKNPQNIVYKVIGSIGVGKNYSLTIESDGRQERFSINGEELNKLKLIIQPSGHISC